MLHSSLICDGQSSGSSACWDFRDNDCDCTCGWTWNNRGVLCCTSEGIPHTFHMLSQYNGKLSHHTFASTNLKKRVMFKEKSSDAK